ncbi:hypothetical protein [Tenggerimyces flavus]|uniref:Uncharacterized protein n=1 Tax=Tenggerimyces flavus TaxID=1708749 RepID=A0ABV7Y769_9ACTN|nr:hypothetical protein [Tenggerimyces flavus]MBM7785046.1 hypothetical protein [Tenggerimyces flavus]
MSEIKLPLDALYPTAQQDLRIQRAEGLLTSRCMRGRGFSYAPPAPFHFDMASARERLFGLIDEKEARAHGYAGRVEAESRPPASPPLSATVEKALTGCVSESAKAVSGGVENVDPSVLDELSMRTGGMAEADERVKAKFREWSACMKAEGFAFADPWQPNDDPRWQPGKPTAVEKRTAVADVRCKHSTGLVDTWYTVLVGYQREAMSTFAGQLGRLADATATRDRNAKRVLADAR